MKKKTNLLLLFCALFFAFNLHAQTSVDGKVTDVDSSDPIAGVNVVVKGTSTGTASDFGDLLANKGYLACGASNKIAVLNLGGYVSSIVATADLIILATTGNSVDFGAVATGGGSKNSSGMCGSHGGIA